jgi:maltooligosyltrehalose trehalohydrolase
MLDIRIIRNEPDRVKTELAKVGVAPAEVDALLEADRVRRDALHAVETLRAERTSASKAIRDLKDPAERERAIAAKVLQEIADRLHALSPPRVVIAEDERPEPRIILPTERGGFGLDGIWADDLHHVLRRRLAGDRHGYYRDYTGSLDELTRTLRQGWLFTGQYSEHLQRPRGTDPSHLPMHRFIVCLQNHDQIGNRATGDRLNQTIDASVWRAASTLLLTSPMTALLFMGQEWAASSPFQYFTDLEPGLGELVTEGRRREFEYFPEFADPVARLRIPDPQDAATFEHSKLDWSERERPPHAQSLALYTELLRLRNTHRALGAAEETSIEATAIGDGTLLMRRHAGGERFLVVVRLEGAGPSSIPHDDAIGPTVVLSTEESRYATDPEPIEISADGRQATVTFRRPGAVIVKY